MADCRRSERNAITLESGAAPLSDFILCCVGCSARREAQSMIWWMRDDGRITAAITSTTNRCRPDRSSASLTANLRRLCRTRAGHLPRAFLAMLDPARPGNCPLDRAGSLQSGQRVFSAGMLFRGQDRLHMAGISTHIVLVIRSGIVYPPCIVIIEVTLIIQRERLSRDVPRE
jgi:hypothetical protein